MLLKSIFSLLSICCQCLESSGRCFFVHQLNGSILPKAKASTFSCQSMFLFTFASSPLDLESLAQEIARAISILEIFYEVDRKKRVDGFGDPRLSELLGFQAKR